MFHIENEYETPIDSDYYQNNESFDNFKKPNNRQTTIDYAKQENEESSNKNNMYHNTTNTILPIKKPLLLESPISKDFLVDSGVFQLNQIL